MNLKLKVLIMQKYGSQIALAHELGMDSSELSKFVRGWRIPKPELQEAIAEKLGVTPGELFE
jgi:transcriptional regulator with XRE-family HTH domain